MNLKQLNLETLLRRGVIVNPYFKKWSRKDCDLCAIVCYKERLRERGLRGRKIKWFWNAYLVISKEDFFKVCDSVSIGVYDKVVFMVIKKSPNNYWPIRPTILEVSNSMDEDESGCEMFKKLRERNNT